MSLDRVTHGTGLFSDVHKWETAVLPSLGNAVCFSSARAHAHTHVIKMLLEKNQILYTIFLKGDTQKGGPGSKPCVYSQNRPAPLYRILAMLLLTE